MKRFETNRLFKLLAVALLFLFVSLFVLNQKDVITQISSKKSEINNSLQSAGNYLVSTIDSSGKFLYQRNVKTGNSMGEYNMLRHAGTIYAMLQLYGETNNKDVLQAAERALAYLQSKTEICYSYEKYSSKVLCVRDGAKLKLGGNGLAILAYEKYAEMTGNDTYNSDSEALARWIMFNQTEKGEFTMHIQYAVTGKKDSHISEYYPGEAIFALTSLYMRTRNSEYLDASERAAQWLITVRDKGKTIENLAHDHWLLYGLHAIAQAKNVVDSIYYNHALHISTAIIATQNTSFEGKEAIWNGGFGGNPRTTPAATRVEGLYAMHKMIVLKNDILDIRTLQKVRTAIIAGSEFLLRTQIDASKVSEYQLSDKSIGSFPDSFSFKNTRIDYTQHAISALLGYRDMYN